MLKILEKIQIGSLELKNRVIMAPLTRMRSNPNGVPSDLNIEHYSQRASAGLIIAESTSISKHGVGYVNAPGIYTQEQVQGWKRVTDEVHRNEGKIFVQLLHVGRISHSDFLDGQKPVAPSSIKPNGQGYTPNGLKDFETPKELSLNEISSIINEFKVAAQNAKNAGFDGIEVHGANGYLINQFIDDVSNKRIDYYGGSITNRSRFLFEVLDAVLEVWDSERVGVRLSPSGIFNSVGDSNPKQTYSYIIERLNDYNLGYLHLMNPMMPINEYPEMVSDVANFYGKLYKGNRIINGGYTRETGNEAIEKGIAEMVSYGHLFIANPDLPMRFELNSDYNDQNPETFYGGGEEGYIDYPFLAHQ
ncbi:alkene reductase [Tenacibaculum sp.]|uniref:alkene reductase n=1 Tax=Tenacibaculum sp. TaxID=1906242 RepID=UPI003D0967C4